MRKVLMLVVAVFLLVLAGGVSSAAEFSVRDFGAAGNGQAKDTVAIQRTIDAAAAAGGVVRLTSGTYLTGTLYLKSGVSLVLDADTVVRASPDRTDYNKPDFAPQNWTGTSESASGAHLIVAVGQTNVAASGKRRRTR